MKRLVDTTLREGAQTVGVSFGLAAKKEIFRRLCRIGVEEIEVGCATALDPDFGRFWRFCRDETAGVRLALWSRCLDRDVAVAQGLRPDVLSLSIPASDLHLKKKLGRDRAWALAAARDCIVRTRDAGIAAVSLGLEDVTRADPLFVDEIVAVALQAGAVRVRLADTVGLATPAEIAGLAERLKKRFPLEIGVHCHNDFGMATANSVAALEAGADWADVTVLGLGERAGCARLEEVAAFLVVRRGCGYDLAGLAALAEAVAGAAGSRIAPHHPVVGKEIFKCETGLHLQGLLRDPVTYEPYPPEMVGARRELLYGAKVGRSEVAAVLGMGWRKDNSAVEEITRLLRKKAGRSGSPTDMDNFRSQVLSVLRRLGLSVNGAELVESISGGSGSG